MRKTIIQFFRGRYGEDELGRFLLMVYLVGFGINLMMDSAFIEVLLMFIVGWILYRILSKNISARSKENQLYLKIILPWRRRIKVIKLNYKDQSYRYYLCPKCYQICRILRTNKKGIVTCPKCFNQFIGRS